MTKSTCPQFTALIVTYNSASEIGDLLGDLNRVAPGSPVIVIDNASQDDTLARAAQACPAARLVANPDNRGYGRAVNQGMGLCRTEYVLLLNPDIRIEQAALCRLLLAPLAANACWAATAPLQYQRQGDRLHLNFTWSYLAPAALRLFLTRRLGLAEPAGGAGARTALPVTFLNAGCLMLRRPAFERAGRLNEQYFLYGEEPDLFLKFKRAGYQCALVSEAWVIHHRERSIARIATPQRLLLRLRGLVNIGNALAVGTFLLLWSAQRPQRLRRRARRSGSRPDGRRLGSPGK